MTDTIVMDADIALEGQPLTQLELSTPEKVGDITWKSPSKSHDLDPQPHTC